MRQLLLIDFYTGAELSNAESNKIGGGESKFHRYVNWKEGLVYREEQLS
jgi:hypothetical protein